jgi:hypothetical protein
VSALCGGDGVEHLTDFLPEGVDAACGGLTKQRFEFGEKLFDGVQVGRIRRQIEQRGLRRSNGFFHSSHFVATEVVEDHDIPGLQRGTQKLPYPGQEQFAIHWPVGDQGRGQLIVPQTRKKSGCLPIAIRGRCDASLSSGGATIATRHVGRCPGFIDEHEFSYVQVRLYRAPAAPRHLHVLALLLAGVQSFF